jgi:YD repeat-containing protein
VANELLALTYFGMSETRQYNSQLQLIRQTVPGAMDMQYIYPTGQNSGRISSSIDYVLGEVLNYTYDPLNRLASAAATNGAWSQWYRYDGFRNLTYKSAAGAYPEYDASIDLATNRFTGMCK